jgi:Cu+-exporting ATPase
VKGAEAKGLILSNVTEFRSITGRGVIGRVEGRRVLLGNLSLLTEDEAADRIFDRIVDQKEGQPIYRAHLSTEQSQQIERMLGLGSEGQTVMLAAIDDQFAGMLAIADPIRESTPEAIHQLHAEGMRIIMLTGDSRATAEAVGRRLGIDEVLAQVLPQDKSAVVKRLQQEGRIVAMAGDGVNDAPALAQADIGIALGTGTDVAMESAGVTLVRGDLRGIVRARHLSRVTMRTIRQNLFLAFVYNTLSIPLAAIGILTPILASATMSLSSVSVIANSLRLRRVSV